MSVRDSKHEWHPPRGDADEGAWPEQEPTITIEEVLPLSAADDAAPVDASRRGGRPPSSKVPNSLDELVRRAPDRFGAVKRDDPSSLEALFYEVSDDDPRSWWDAEVRAAVPRAEAITLTRTSGFPAARLPDERRRRRRSPPAPTKASSDATAPVSIDAPLSLDQELPSPRRRRRSRWATAGYLAGLVAAALGGAWLAQGSAAEPVPSALRAGWTSRALAAAGPATAVTARPDSTTVALAAGERRFAGAETAATPSAGDAPAEEAAGAFASAPADPRPGPRHQTLAEGEPAADEGPAPQDDVEPGDPYESPRGATVERASEPREQEGSRGSEPEVDDASTNPTAPFDRARARAALDAAAGAAAGCAHDDGGTRRVPVAVTFAPSGRVTTALVTGGRFAGTSTGSCVARAFRGVQTAPFAGSFVTVQKTVRLR